LGYNHYMKTINEINLELQEATQAERQAQLDAEYDEFVEWVYYCLTCEQLDKEWIYNEFG
jgi:hypothetical protein